MRTVLNVQQGSDDWLSARALCDGTASEAPAAGGKSKYQSRTELLAQKHTGLTKSVDSKTQELFNRGHAAEASARSIAEEIIGDELSPTTMTLEIDGLKLLASLDGITFDDGVIFEHKLWSESLADDVENNTLSEHYTIQMDQQLLVSGAERCLFMVSDGTKEKNVWCWYETTEEKKAAVVSAWRQFKRDLAEYVPPEVKEAPKTEAVESFPVPAILVRGELVECNLDAITPYFDKFLLETKTRLVTDEDFAQGEVNAKASRDAAKNCKLTAKAVVDQIMPVSDVVRTLERYASEFDKLGLALEKAVKEQKEAIKANAISDARNQFTQHVSQLDDEVKPIRLMIDMPDFAGVIKGLKTLASLHNAIATALANAKIDADAKAKDIRAKLAWCKEHAAGMSMLFPDLQQIISKPMDDFTLLITSRIDAHKKAEAERIDAERAKIKAEEESKAQKHAQSEDVTSTGSGGAAPLSPANVIDIEHQRASVIESQDIISSFFKTRNFSKQKENEYRAVLVEFIKHQSAHQIKAAA